MWIPDIWPFPVIRSHQTCCSLNASGTGGSGLRLQLQLYGQLSNKGLRAVDALDIVLCKVGRVWWIFSQLNNQSKQKYLNFRNLNSEDNDGNEKEFWIFPFWSSSLPFRNYLVDQLRTAMPGRRRLLRFRSILSRDNVSGLCLINWHLH